MRPHTSQPSRITGLRSVPKLYSSATKARVCAQLIRSRYVTAHARPADKRATSGSQVRCHNSYTTTPYRIQISATVYDIATVYSRILLLVRSLECRHNSSAVYAIKLAQRACSRSWLIEIALISLMRMLNLYEIVNVVSC